MGPSGLMVIHLIFSKKNKEVGIHNIELRSLSMISEGFWGGYILGATTIGSNFINSIGFKKYIQREGLISWQPTRLGKIWKMATNVLAKFFSPNRRTMQPKAHRSQTCAGAIRLPDNVLRIIRRLAPSSSCPSFFMATASAWAISFWHILTQLIDTGACVAFNCRAALPLPSDGGWQPYSTSP